MAHYAKIDSSHVVVTVHVVSDENENGSEENGIKFLTSLHGDISPMYWKKTSYNTVVNTHRLGGTPFRKNYAGKGMTYDSVRDAFIHARPRKSNAAIDHLSWIFNEDKCTYEPPVEWPEGPVIHDGKEMIVSWDEHKVRFVGTHGTDLDDSTAVLYAWDPSAKTWSATGFTRAQFLDINYTGD